MKRKILIIGNGAKEYALAKYFAKENEVYITPGSDTLKEFAACIDIREDSSAELLEFVMENGIDMTIPVSEKSIKTDIVGLFNNNNQKIFAPDYEPSKIAYDKAFAKKILYKLRIPTPKFGIFEKQNMAVDYIKNQKTPFVIKTNALNSAAVFTSYGNAKHVVDNSFIEKNNKLIVEDYVYGTPFSFYTITDGYKALPFGSSISYKHSLEGDGGQLTGGMGACSPNYKLSLEHEYFLMDNVIYPLIDYMQIESTPYMGILGVNGIITDEGKLSILGWHNFMQDCDTAAILETIDENLFELFDSCIIGSFSDEIESIKTKDLYAATLVLNCKNKQNEENVITGLDDLDENTVATFYPTVVKNKYLEYEANTGAVLSITSTAPTASSAVNRMYSEAEGVKFNSVYYRKDIGLVNKS